MSAAYDRLSAGYYNVSLRSGSNPGGITGIGAMRVNWEPFLVDYVTVAAETAAAKAAAEAAAAAAFAAPSSQATSDTDYTIPGAIGGTAVFHVVEADRLYSKGQTVVVSADADASAQVSGRIDDWNPGTQMLTVAIQFLGDGVGEFTLWNIALTAPVDATLTGRVNALEAANALRRDQALFYGKEFS